MVDVFFFSISLSLTEHFAINMCFERKERRSQKLIRSDEYMNSGEQTQLSEKQTT